MRKHILIERAKSYPEPTDRLTPEGYTFSSRGGYWADNQHGKPLMLSNDPKRPQTKKCDRETGEDQKGE